MTIRISTTRVDLDDKELRQAVLQDYAQSVNVLGSAGGGRKIDLELGNVVTCTVATSTNTFTFFNPSWLNTACSFTLILTNGGSQTVYWPLSVRWAGGTVPTLTTAGVDIISFLTTDGGLNWYGFVAGLDVQ